jgi:hypothetical protein
MVAPPTFKPDDIELVPDSWARFERAVDRVSKSGPQHRSASQRQSKAAAPPEDADWQVWGFGAGPETVEGQPLPPSSLTEENPSRQRVVAYFRQSETEAELVFPGSPA